MGGDLNLTLGVVEIWGLKAILDPLSDFFENHLAQLNVFNIEPIKLNPTCRYKREGEHMILKRLDRFLVGEDIVFSQSSQALQWVEWGGEFEHNPIVLKIKGGMHKPPSPFKFNASWIVDPDYIALLKSIWVPLNLVGGNRARYLFMENLKRFKKEAIRWAKAKKSRQEVELVEMEMSLALMMEGEGLGFQSEGAKAALVKKRNKGRKFWPTERNF